MDTRQTPFGDHPDGGKIRKLKEGETVPDYVMPISLQAEKALANIPQQERVDYILHANDPRLYAEKLWLENRLRKQHEAEFLKQQNKS